MRSLIFLALSMLSYCASAQVKLFDAGLFGDDQYFGLTISPEGNEIFFVKSFHGRDTLQIYHSVKVKGRWQTPVLAPFADTKFRQIDPAFTPDGKAVLFNSQDPANNNFDIYMSRKTKTGWSAAEKLPEPLSTEGNEFFATAASNGNIYFTRRAASMDIYRSELREGKYQTAVPLGPQINTTGSESNPYISKDEDMLIFFANYPGGFGETDLYVSFRKEDQWSKPVNLGKEINTAAGEFCPAIDWKGKRFIFARTEVIKGKRKENIYVYPLKDLRLDQLKAGAAWDQ